MSALHPLHQPEAKRSKGQTDPHAPPLAVSSVRILERALSIPVMHFLKDSMWSTGLESFWISASGQQEILEQGRCCLLSLPLHSALTLDFSSSSKMIFLGRGGGGGKGASSGSFGSHFTIPAVETNGEVRRGDPPLGDGTAT